MKSIRVLEDEPCVMNLFRLVLLRAGYSLKEAGCAEQAERCAELEPDFSLLIADVTPPCSGIGVSVHVKACNPLLKIVLTSGCPPGMWSDQDTALYDELSSDSVRILSKRFKPSDLLSIVDDLIGSSGVASRWLSL